MSQWTAILVCLSVLAHFLEEYHWIFSLIINFREWFLWICLLLILLAPWINRNRMGIVGLTLLAVSVHLVQVYPYFNFNRQNESSSNSQTLDIFYANLNTGNENKNQLLNYLKKKKPDFVLLVEFNSAWAEEIKHLESIYPFSKAIIRENNFGMAVLSKTPIDVENTFVDRVNIIPALFLKSKSAIDLNLILIHAYPPIGEYGTMVRNQYLQTISRKIAELKSPTLVCGDFNTAPWTMIFASFLRNADLTFDKTYSAPNTWPNMNFVPQLPIDHCLARGFKILSYKSGPNIDSDHLPLTLKLFLGNAVIAKDAQ